VDPETTHKPEYRTGHGIDLDDLLVKTSRTFALSIPLLPEPDRTRVGLAYLLYRVADTFEDAVTWPPVRRLAALDLFEAFLDDRRAPRVRIIADDWVRDPPILHDGYTELLGATPGILALLDDMVPAARGIVIEHLKRTVRGMYAYVERTEESGSLRLRDLDDLREYCYIVAGIVGEMLTELILHEHAELRPRAAYLRERSRAFGEGLQLVNILKDTDFDADEGRHYLPRGLRRDTVLALARDDLRRASEYTLALHELHADHGLIAYHALLIQLARGSLRHLEERGPGAKLTRDEVFAILRQLEDDVEGGRAPVTLDGERD